MSYSFKDRSSTVVDLISPIILIVGFCFLFPSVCFGQDQFARSLTVGTSYTYIWDRSNLAQGVNPISYQEHTWNANIALEILPRWHFGLMYLNVNTTSELNAERRARSQLFGVFNQFDILPIKEKRRSRIFGEVQYLYGDHCTCGELDPFPRSGLHYISLGGGVEIPLYKQLRLDLAFYSANILNDVPLKYNFTQYVIGLNYRLISK
jgi:hypothetical protein